MMSSLSYLFSGSQALPRCLCGAPTWRCGLLPFKPPPHICPGFSSVQDIQAFYCNRNMWSCYSQALGYFLQQHYRPLLIQYHQVPTSIATYWPSTIMYQPVSPSSDPVPPSTDRYRLLLTQYHHISTSTAPYWHSTTKYQSIPTYNDPVPSYINQYRLLLTQYHQVPTSTTSYWPSTTKYQPLPLSTDPVPSYIKQYHSIPTQYQQVSTSTPPFCCYSRTTDSCTVYPGSCHIWIHYILALHFGW